MKLFNYLFLLLTFQGFAQYCPYLGSDQLLPCGVGTTTLTADLSQCRVGYQKTDGKYMITGNVNLIR